MKHRFLAHDPDAQSLTIFFAGWGSSPERFRDLRPAGGQDLFLLWDFDGAGGALPDLSRYETVDVVGWSLGVRIAADWVMESPVPVRRFTAVAGTLSPIDRRLGIPPTVFDRTTDRFGEATLEGVLLNMTGSVEAARTLRGTERTLDSLGHELRLLRDTYREECRHHELQYSSDRRVFHGFKRIHKSRQQVELSKLRKLHRQLQETACHHADR